ncbi:hypothetical protein NBD15_23185, partial [Salmonella sp. NW1009]
WQSPGSSASPPVDGLGLFGVQALARGGIGTSGNGAGGGHGGDATSASVTLTQGANVAVTTQGVPWSYNVGIGYYIGAGAAAVVTGGAGNGGM